MYILPSICCLILLSVDKKLNMMKKCFISTMFLMESFLMLKDFFMLNNNYDSSCPLVEQSAFFSPYITYYEKSTDSYIIFLYLFIFVFIAVAALILFYFVKLKSSNLMDTVCMYLSGAIISLCLISLSIKKNLKIFKVLSELEFVYDMIFLILTFYIVFCNLNNILNVGLKNVEQKVYLGMNMLTILFLIYFVKNIFSHTFMGFFVILSNLNNLDSALGKLSV